MAASSSEPKAPGRNEAIKIGIDLAPLVIALVTYFVGGVFWATGALMVATVASVIASWVLFRHVSPSLLLTTVLVVGFGSLTLWFNDPRFIKIKPTIVYLLFAALLFGGLLMGKPTLQLLLGQAFRMPQAAWATLSVRWGVFFLVMAALNEVIWRTQTDAFWWTFKAFGFVPLTIAFFATQLGYIQRHQLPPPDASDNPAS